MTTLMSSSKDGWYETQHCSNCDGYGRAYYGPDYEFKKTCLSCKGSGWKEVWVSREGRERELAIAREKEENQRIEDARRRVVEEKRQAEREAINTVLIVVAVVIAIFLIVILPWYIWLLVFFLIGLFSK